MKRYVLGFLFDPDADHVVLIRKKRPEWQAGLLNGVGGEIEELETPYNAMVREFREETGIQHSSWEGVGSMGDGRTWYCHLFTTRSPRYDQVRSTTDEEVAAYLVANLHWLEVVPNLRWLVPLCAAKTGPKGTRPTRAEFTYGEAGE